MKYISTRGEAQATGFVEAVLGGLAPDGGLYIPDTWPQFAPGEIAAFAGRPYAEVAAEVIGRFASPAIHRDDMAAMCAEAYASFTHPAVTPLKELYPGLFLLELFHGPTLAFKDVAMQLLAQLYDHVLRLQRRTLTIVCATSGDTGGAAVEAFRGRSNVRIVALFPEGRISEVQRRFMTTADDANVACVSIEGTFDDCQTILKSMFTDEAFARDVDLSGVNSINWARIAAQAVYYFTAGVALGAPHRPVSFCVPTGNFGDAFAGYVARRMGLPIERIVVATNANDILARALSEGDYARGAVMATQSPAMDIQIASNFERLYFEAARRDSDVTAGAFRAFAAEGAIRVPQSALAAMRELFVGTAVSEDETTRAIVSTFNETGELIDPHTAVAVAAAQRMGSGKAATPLIALSTAHPAKFPDSVEAAAGVTPVLPRSVGDHSAKPERFERLPADAEAVKAYVHAFAGG
jgi:threonine synthase